MVADTIGVVSIATNRYLDYWSHLARSADKNFFPDSAVTLHVFTDRPTDARRVASHLSRIEVRVFETPPMGWPDATLQRFALISQQASEIQGEVLVHLDADTVVAASCGPELAPRDWRGGLAFVRHPGYARGVAHRRALDYIQTPKLLIRDALLVRSQGALGTWETDPNSQAYVPRAVRHTYACGGVWMGVREPFLQMCGELALRVDADTESGILAVWHDESHLNWYAATHDHSILGPEYCFVDGYRHLERVQPRIRAVEKGADRTR